MKNTNFTKSVLALGTIVLGATSLVSADALYRQLQLGMSGSDVRTLQTFLAVDPTIYPQGRVTGYFGYLTKSAVSNFQARNGIATVGRVGPQTLGVINAQMLTGGNTGGDAYAPSISNLNVTTSSNSATVMWNTSEGAKGVVYYSNIPLTTYENDNSVNVSGMTAMTDNSLRTYQSVSLSNLQSNTTYYYLIYVTDSNGNVSVTMPNKTFRTN